MKQKTLRVFEVEDFEKLKNIVQSKYELLKKYYFMLKKSDKKIENFLKEKKLNYFILNSEDSFTSKKEISTKDLPKIRIIEKEIIREKKTNIKIFDKIIRNGEEIKLDADAVFLKRINPGAKIIIKGNAFILGENNGFITVEGQYLLIKKNNSHLSFNAEDLGNIDKLTFFYNNKRQEI